MKIATALAIINGDPLIAAVAFSAAMLFWLKSE